MAVTAAITLSSATSVAGQPVTVVCTLTNGGGSDEFLVGLQPTVSPIAAPAVLGAPQPGGTIAASGGTLKKSWVVTPDAPASSYGLAQPASLAYVLGAAFQTSGGTSTVASTSTLTVANAGN